LPMSGRRRCCLAISDRERFLTTLAYRPASSADTIVCLAGEEGEARARAAASLFKMGLGQGIVVTGGRHEPPTHIGAKLLTTLILGHGIAHDRVLTDEAPQHTREQAVAVVAQAVEKGWKRLTLVASDYHMPRCYLTFLRALQEAGAVETIYLVPAAVLGSARFGERLAVELGKVAEYGSHVASYAEGVAYLDAWVGR
jgi:uncharacterized SAM-binding protein YcdF (DUF218 family)